MLNTLLEIQFPVVCYTEVGRINDELFSSRQAGIYNLRLMMEGASKKDRAVRVFFARGSTYL